MNKTEQIPAASAPRVSVCCAWYERPEAIKDTISGLSRQDINEFEIIVVNDGSPDERVQGFLESYDLPNLTVARQSNTGASGALNHAISLARAPYIAVHDAGDVSLPSRLREQAEALDRYPAVVGVGCYTEDVEVGADSGIPPVLNDDKPPVLTWRDFLEGKNHLSGGEVMFRKQVYMDVGGYREAFRYAEDRDLWLRMSERGDFRVVQKLLYRRCIFAAGVKGSLKKSIMQKHLSYFARECARSRAEKGYDLVDVFGKQAGLFRRRTLVQSNFLARTSLWYFYHGDLHSSKLTAQLAFREKKALRSSGMLLINFLSARSGPCEKIIRRLLHKKASKQVMQKPEELIS